MTRLTFGPYEILERWDLEGGGFDALARDGAGREVRLWVGTEAGDLEATRDRLARVYQTALPRVLGAEVLEGRPVLRVQPYRGERLSDRLDGEGLDPPIAMDVCRAVGAALVKAHRAGLAHGALSPSEILLGEDGRTLLLHVGFGSHLGPRAPRAPEDLHSEPGESSDVFSLARLLIRALTGQDPVEGDDFARFAARAPRAEGDFPAELPEGLRRFLARSIHPDRTIRIHRAEEFAGDLGVIRASWESWGRGGAGSGAGVPRWLGWIAVAVAAAVIGTAIALRACKP